MDHNKWIGNYYVSSNGEMLVNTIIGDYIINNSGKATYSKDAALFNQPIEQFKNYQLQLAESKKYVYFQDINNDGQNELILGIKYYSEGPIGLVGIYMVNQSGIIQEIKSFYDQDINGTARNSIRMFRNGYVFYQNGMRYREGHLRRIMNKTLITIYDGDYDSARQNEDDYFVLKDLSEIFVNVTDWIAL